MTREEAIKILKFQAGYFCDLKGCEEQQAFTMAIKALEQEPCDDCISREDALMALTGEWTEPTDELIHRFIRRIKKLPSVNPKRTGHWIYSIYGDFHEQGNWLCSHCNYQFNHGNGHAEYCPKCAYEMSEAPTEEVIS